MRMLSQYRDEPSLTRTLSGPGTAGFTTVRYLTLMMPSSWTPIFLNAVRLRSMWPASHGGQESMTLTRTLPFGPVTSRYVPQPAPPEYSLAWESATNRSSPGGLGYEQLPSVPSRSKYVAMPLLPDVDGGAAQAEPPFCRNRARPTMPARMTAPPVA